MSSSLVPAHTAPVKDKAKKVSSLTSAVFLNDGGPGRPNYFWGFYWFVAEAILGSIAALSSAEPVTDRMPERLIVPWEPNFQESTGANEQIVHRVFKECASSHYAE